jgi:YggT family protein
MPTRLKLPKSGCGPFTELSEKSYRTHVILHSKGIELVNILTGLLSNLIWYYTLIVIVNVILSWVVHSTQNMVIRRIYWTTGQFVEPALAPIRQLLSPLTRNLGGIDISPIILIIFLRLLQDVLH